MIPHSLLKTPFMTRLKISSIWILRDFLCVCVSECRSFQWKCPNKVCMTLSYRCDGYNDCGCDGEDCDENGCDGLAIGIFLRKQLIKLEQGFTDKDFVNNKATGVLLLLHNIVLVLSLFYSQHAFKREKISHKNIIISIVRAIILKIKCLHVPSKNVVTCLDTQTCQRKPLAK